MKSRTYCWRVLLIRAGQMALAVMIASGSVVADGRAATEESAIAVDLPAEALADALQQLAIQAKLQILFEKSAVAGLRAPAVSGSLTPMAALERLLRGTDLEFVRSADGAYVIRVRAKPAAKHTDVTGADGVAQYAIAGLEEVVVTATRRKERAQDIAMSVLALSQDALDARGVRSIDDLSRLSPGVTFTRNGTAGVSNYNDESSDISIRGIDSSAGTSTTGIYIDDTPVQSRHIGFGTLNAFPALFDLERVELLRGPQGTLFGAGAEGGAIRFITPDPDLKNYAAFVRSEVATTRHGDASYEVGAAGGGPLLPGTLGFRASASYRRDGGYVDRVNYQTQQPAESAANWMDTATFRAALKWAINDRVSITPSVLFQRLYLNDTAAYWPELSNPDSAVFRNGNAQANSSTDPFYLAALRANWELDSVRLTNNLSYYSRSQHSTSDYTQFDRTAYLLIPTYGPRPPAGDRGSAFFEDHQNNFYEELRAESRDPAALFVWSAGIFYSRLNEDSIENVFDRTLNAEYNSYYTVNPNPYFPPPPFCTAIAPCPNGQILNQPSLRVIDRQLAAFGEASYKIIDTLKVTAGVRVARTSYSADGQFYGPFIGPTIGPATPVIFAGSHAETPVTPKLVLAYQPDRDTLYYASAAKGYRVGGINTTLGSVCAYDLGTIGLTDAPNQYRSDSLWSYELGTKLTLAERRVQINASVYLIDWSNIQQNVYLPTCALTYVANLGKARSTGGDLDVQFRPSANVQLDLTIARTDAKYTQTVCGSALVACTGAGASTAPVVSSGDRLRGAPWTVVLAGEYGFSLNETRPYLRADYSFTSAQTATLPNQNPDNALTDPTIPGLPQTRSLALRAGMRVGGLDLSLFAQNVTNQQPVLFSARDSLASDLYFSRSVRPRTLGLTANYRY